MKKSKVEDVLEKMSLVKDFYGEKKLLQKYGERVNDILVNGRGVGMSKKRDEDNRVIGYIDLHQTVDQLIAERRPFSKDLRDAKEFYHRAIKQRKEYLKDISELKLTFDEKDKVEFKEKSLKRLIDELDRDIKHCKWTINLYEGYIKEASEKEKKADDECSKLSKKEQADPDASEREEYYHFQYSYHLKKSIYARESKEEWVEKLKKENEKLLVLEAKLKEVRNDK